MDFLNPGKWLDAISKALALIASYPDVVALILGSLIGYVFTVMIERYFLPIYTDPKDQRRQQGLTFLLCWLASATCSSLLWLFLDPKDRPFERIAISLLVGVLSFPGYPFLAKLATSLYPKVGSAWSNHRPNGGS
jgi:hypothetical protein